MAKRKETTFDIPATKFIIATGLFRSEEFDMAPRKDGCYAPLRNPADDVRTAMKQLMNVDPKNAYPILMDYIRMTVGSLLLGQSPAKVHNVYFNFNKKLCPNAFTAFPESVEFEVYDAAEVLDDLTLYSAQLGVEYLRLMSIISENLDNACKTVETSQDFENKVWHNFQMLRTYAKRLLMSRWYRVYLENNQPSPDYNRLRENSFAYIHSYSADEFIKEHAAIKNCINVHPEFFYHNGCL